MITIPQRLLGEALLISAKKKPQQPAIIYKDIEYSYENLKDSALKLSAYLRSIGIKKGERVAVFMNNSFECAVSIYGISIAGAVFMVINPQTKTDKLKYILEDSGAICIISENFLADEVTSALSDSKNQINVIFTNAQGINKPLKINYQSFEEVLSSKTPVVNEVSIIPNDLAALIYTSGSTGFPKGVMMTHQSMVFTSWSLIEYLRLTEDERIMLLLPLAFDYGLYQLIMSVTVGGTLIMEQSFTFVASIYKRIINYKATVFPGVPTIYAMMIENHKKSGISFEGIRKVTNTAAALPEEFIPNLKKIFPNALIFKMYGLTECKRVSYLEPELVDLKPASVGKAIPGTEVFLLSPDGKKVPPGEAGILHVRGPHVMAGYWNKDDLSKEMLKPGFLPGERILCAQDLFKMDEEGFLYFQGRKDDIIKTKGEKVSPIEVENVIYKMTHVKEVAVIGIDHPIMGEAIMAFITTHNNVGILEKDVQTECMSKLESFMVPYKVVLLPEMPKSSNGKIDKLELKKNYSLQV
jgi:long-chain acyl-CoA synthetase